MTPCIHPRQDDAPAKSTDRAFDLTLSNAMREACFMTALAYPGPCREVTHQNLMRQAQKLAVHLSPLASDLQALKKLNGYDYGVIRNLPVDPQLPPPPTDGQRPAAKKTWISELVLLAIAVAAELEPFSYQQLQSKALISEIAPAANHEQSASSLGRTAFGFHTEWSVFQREFRPEVLMLYGVYNPSQTPTLIATLADVMVWLKREAPAVIPVLQSPRFRLRNSDVMVIGPGKRVYSEPRPIITEVPEGGLEIAGNFSTLEALDEEAQAAIAVLVSAFEQVASPIVLQPGMVLMFNNFRCVHGRGPFSGDRWLQRLYAHEALKALRRVTGQGGDARLFDVRPLILV